MTLRHAIIGCGRVAPSHADAFARLPDVDLAVLCDPDEAAARSLASRFAPEAAVAGDYRQVLEDPSVHSVSLCVPHHLHAPMTLAALEHGKHVLVEKPFAMTVEEGLAVRDAQARRGRIVQPVSQHRFDAVVRMVEEMVAAGDLGEICLVRAHLECKRDPAYYGESPWRGRWATEGGSVLINQAYHVMDLLLRLAGPAATASALMDTLQGRQFMETEDALAGTLRFRSGALGSLTVNGASGAKWHSYLELSGTKGVVGFDLGYPNQVPRLHLESRRALQAWRKRLQALAETVRIPTPGVDYYGDSHREEARAFVEGIRGGDRGPAADPAQALQVVSTILALYESARTGTAATPRVAAGEALHV